MSVDDLQERVQAGIDDLVATGEVGLQAAVVEHGQVAMDAVAGLADSRRGLAVAPDSLFFAASTAKGVVSAVAHVLMERGELAYDMRAVEVWPEFGAHGKDRVTLRHVLTHTAGVPAPPYDITVADLRDWDHMCAMLAAAKPWWGAGHPLWVPRADVRFPARRNRAARHGPPPVSGGFVKRLPVRWASRTRCTSGSRRRCWIGWHTRSRLKGRRSRPSSRDRRPIGRTRPASIPTPTTPTGLTC